MKPVDPFAGERKVWTVSEISREIRNLVEPRFPDIWVQGEASNVRTSSAGHVYFTLKDESAQIPAVCFRSSARYLRFRPENGTSYRARGRVGIYEGRGEYQLIVEVLEPAGRGALEKRFIELKERLEREGLFDPARKRGLPKFPGRIGVVSSPTSAAVRDLLTVLDRRHDSIGVLIYPTDVQGAAAGAEIARGIETLGRMDVDLVIVTRGGGSIEDLWAFNEERVARAIAGCRVPVVSAVGHETDFTISDFVADVRAPTPSAAAEIVSSSKVVLKERLETAETRMRSALRFRLSELGRFLADRVGGRGFVMAQARIGRLSQRVDDYTFRLSRILASGEPVRRASQKIERFDGAAPALIEDRLDRMRRRMNAAGDVLSRGMKAVLGGRRQRYSGLVEMLDALSPLAVLDRGYAVVRTGQGVVVRSASDVELDSSIDVRLSEGRIQARVTSRHTAESDGGGEGNDG